MIEIQKFEIEGPLLITPRTFTDDRGIFVERYNRKTFQEAGLHIDFIQDNFSRSSPGVVRGLHYQRNPDQLKLVTCLSGSIQDVIVDLRRNSPTFGRHISVELSGDRPQWFLVPVGFGHGFTVTSSVAADVMYKVDNYYSPTGEGAILWNDPALNISWRVKSPVVSGKDQQAQTWDSFQKNNPF